jgi:hypothetical protein
MTRGPTEVPISGTVTRRSILRLGALLFCAPAIVRSTSLMRVGSFVVPVVDPRWRAGFCERSLICWRGSDQIAGRTPAVLLNGRTISIPEAQRQVAFARANRWVND